MARLPLAARTRAYVFPAGAREQSGRWFSARAGLEHAADAPPLVAIAKSWAGKQSKPVVEAPLLVAETIEAMERGILRDDLNSTVKVLLWFSRLWGRRLHALPECATADQRLL